MAISSRSSFIVAGALSAALAACSAEPKNAVFECKTPGKDQSATVYESGGVFTLKTHEVVSGHVADETKFFGNEGDARKAAQDFCGPTEP